VSLPETIAKPLVRRLDLAIVEMPLRLPTFTHSMIWHRRHTGDPAHAWFRSLVARAVGRAPLTPSRRGRKRRREREAGT
jgi:DNA-binding transcriptional LysR family regulator